MLVLAQNNKLIGIKKDLLSFSIVLVRVEWVKSVYLWKYIYLAIDSLIIVLRITVRLQNNKPFVSYRTLTFSLESTDNTFSSIILTHTKRYQINNSLIHSWFSFLGWRDVEIAEQFKTAHLVKCYYLSKESVMFIWLNICWMWKRKEKSYH